MTKPKTILALDLGTKCGWAIGDGARAPTFGTWDLSDKKHGGRGSRYDAMIALAYGLSTANEARIFPAATVESIAYEIVARHVGTTAAHVYGGFLACAHIAAHYTGVPLVGYPVGTIKKHATGKGNASKVMMKAAANAKWGIEVGDDNQADALWILDLALTRGV